MNENAAWAECPDCCGGGRVFAFVEYADGGGDYGRTSCVTCKGAGVVVADMITWRKHGAYLRKGRIAAGLTQRQAAAELSITPQLLSKAENGMINPGDVPEIRTLLEEWSDE